VRAVRKDAPLKPVDKMLQDVVRLLQGGRIRRPTVTDRTGRTGAAPQQQPACI